MIQFHPPLFLFTVPEGPLPVPNNFLQSVAAAAENPGMNPYVKIQFSDAFSNNFAIIDQMLAYFPDDSLIHIALGALPLNSNAGITYRTITLPLISANSGNNGNPVSTVLPVIWDQGFITDFLQALTNIKNYLISKGYLNRLFAIGFCPDQRIPNDGEFTIPSSNSNPSVDFSAYYVGGTAPDGSIQPGVGYTDALAIQALNTIAAGAAQIFPAPILLQFAFLSSTTQSLGVGNDPTSALAQSMFNGMLDSATRAEGLLCAIQQSYQPSIPNSNFAINNGLTSGRLLLQLIPQISANTDIDNALAACIAYSPELKQIQIHPNQATEASSYMSSNGYTSDDANDASVNEIYAIYDTVNPGPSIFTASVSEAGSLQDTVSKGYLVSITENGNASDTTNIAPSTYAGTVIEVNSVSDFTDRRASLVAQVTETGSATDVTDCGVIGMVYTASCQESMSASDTADSSLEIGMVAESISAVDSTNVTNSIYNVSVAETCSATDIVGISIPRVIFLPGVGFVSFPDTNFVSYL